MTYQDEPRKGVMSMDRFMTINRRARDAMAREAQAMAKTKRECETRPADRYCLKEATKDCGGACSP